MCACARARARARARTCRARVERGRKMRWKLFLGGNSILRKWFIENEPTAPAEQAHTHAHRTVLGGNGVEVEMCLWWK